MTDNMKDILDTAKVNSAFRDATEGVDYTLELDSPSVLRIHYPNALDIKGTLSCENVDVPAEERGFLEPNIFVKFFLSNRTSIAPRIYQRWALLSGISSMLGRNIWMEEEGKKTFPNLYVALVGESGSGKSLAIDMVKPLMSRAGYACIADAATTKDKFLMDMKDSFSYTEDKQKNLEQQLDEDFLDSTRGSEYCEGWICCHEWNEYFRTSGNQGNFDFINAILAMYDNPESMATRSKAGGNIYVPFPTLSILGGTTINSLLQFAPLLSAEPFYSRTLLIYSAPTNQIYQPAKTSKELDSAVVEDLRRIRELQGEMRFHPDARDLFNAVVESQTENRVADSRLNPFYSRRNLHLQKLCMVIAASHFSLEISANDVIHANSILLFAESFMQRALGEYGGMRQGIPETVIMQALNSSPTPMTTQQLIAATHHVIDNVSRLGELCGKLALMKRISLLSDSRWTSLQKSFRMTHILARVLELYEYH